MKAKLTLAITSILAAVMAWSSQDTYRWNGDNSTGKWLTENAWEAVGTVTSTYPQSDDVAILPDGTSILLNGDGACVSNITVAAGENAALKTDAGNASRTIYAREISGGGTLTLQGIYLYGRGSSTLTVDNDLVFGGSLENRIVKSKGYNNIINGKISGSGTLKFATAASGATSSSYQQVNGDNSGFSGLVYIDGGTFDRFHFGRAESGSENARWVVRGTQPGLVMDDFDSPGVIKFGSFYTEEIANDKSYIRLNSHDNTLVIGALNGRYNNVDVTDRITLTLGDANNAKERIVKVGTGTLQLGDTRHFGDTIISNGIVEAVHSAALTKGVVTFDGGSLKYGDRLYTGDDAAWGSQSIKNSTKDVVIDTGTNDVIYATAIDSSNVGGFVKKGAGTLEVQGYSAYAGKTIVSNGTLKVGFQYNNTDGLGGRAFEKSNDAALEITLYNPSTTHANEATILTGIPNGSTVNFTVSNDDGRGLPRFTEVTTFSGILNFMTSKTTSGGAGGLVGSAATLGSDSIEWNITGEPVNAHTRLFDVEGVNSGAVAKFGALRQTSPNGMIYSKYGNNTLKIGALGKDSVINGQIETYSSDNAVTVQSIGGKLTLGENFAVVANGGTEYTGTATFNITGGAFENNANLSAYTVTLSDGVTLSGTGTWPASMSLPASYSVPAKPGETTQLTNIDVDFTNGVSLMIDLDGFDKTATGVEYDLLVAKSITGVPDKSLLDSINSGDTKGRWKFSCKNGNTLVLRYAKNGMMIIFR